MFITLMSGVLLMTSVLFSAAHADENGLCEITIRVSDETGRPLPHFRVDIRERFCKDTQGFLHECTAISDADGVATYTLVRGEVSPEAFETISAQLDQGIIDKTQSLNISCMSVNTILFRDIFRSARGLVVFRHRPTQTTCGYVLLVHGMRVSPGDRCGYNGGEGTWCHASREFAGLGYGVAEFLYPTGGRIQPSALRLGSALARVEELTDIQRWFVLAHSFGGLVARECISGNKLCQERFHALVTLGTPHLGVGLWCSLFACSPRSQLYEGSWYLRTLSERPLITVPSLAIGGTEQGGLACTSDNTESDGIVKVGSAMPSAFATLYETEGFPFDHGELACALDESHSAFRSAVRFFSTSGGCSFPCSTKETTCGIGAFPCCVDGIDNDCDGGTDDFDIDCLDVDPGEF